MSGDPPKKEAPSESSLPTAPNIPRGTINVKNTITRKQFAQLSGSEAPHICSAAIDAEHEAKELLQKDKSNRWLYLVARGKLELGLMLEIMRYERIGARRGYDTCGLKKSNQDLAQFFGTGSDSMSRSKNALLRRGLIDTVDGVLQLRYAAVLKDAKAKGWSRNIKCRSK